jgi:hypothetical protein
MEEECMNTLQQEEETFVEQGKDGVTNSYEEATLRSH